ncbi:helix-turn-helix domain protein [Actinobacteria bacterium OK074]|nr:helix-turn-helix domain protein [Actinobacteria bacterium OK074]
MYQPQAPRPTPPPTRTTATPQPTPPFDARAARRLRVALGMGCEHVAHDLRASYGLPHVSAELVIAWERGTAAPTTVELAALAGVLWCSTGELIGSPRTLREHRVARGLSPEAVAAAVGLELPAYVRMEEADRWRGGERQSAALAELLQLTLPDYVTLTGRDGRLAELLRGAVTTRWQAYARPLAKLVGLDRRLVEDVLRAMHADYQGRMVATLDLGAGTAATASGDAGRDFLDRIVPTFWTTVEEHAH